MNGNAMFFDSMDGDRIYNAADFREWLHRLFSEGVSINDFYTTATGGMTINVTGGYTHIRGACKTFTADTVLTLQPADKTLPRIDAVVLELDIPAKTIELKIRSGSAALDPAAPELVRTEDIWQLQLCTVAISPGMKEITQAEIDDTRIDIDVCGYLIRSACDNSMSEIVALYRKRTAEIIESTGADFWEWFETQKATFTPDMRDQIERMMQEMTEQQSEVTGILEDYDRQMDVIDDKIRNAGKGGGSVDYRHIATLHEGNNWSCDIPGTSTSTDVFRPTMLLAQVRMRYVGDSYGDPGIETRKIDIVTGMSSVDDGYITMNVVLKQDSSSSSTYRGSVSAIGFDQDVTLQTYIGATIVVNTTYSTSTRKFSITSMRTTDDQSASSMDADVTSGRTNGQEHVSQFMFYTYSSSGGYNLVSLKGPIIAIFDKTV